MTRTSRAGGCLWLGSLLALVLALACEDARMRECAAPPAGRASTEWPSYGNDAGGTRYAAIADITRDLFHPRGEARRVAESGVVHAEIVADPSHDDAFRQ